MSCQKIKKMSSWFCTYIGYTYLDFIPYFKNNIKFPKSRIRHFGEKHNM